jgi:hypothetical protein
MNAAEITRVPTETKQTIPIVDFTKAKYRIIFHESFDFTDDGQIAIYGNGRVVIIPKIAERDSAFTIVLHPGYWVEENSRPSGGGGQCLAIRSREDLNFEQLIPTDLILDVSLECRKTTNRSADLIR